MNLEFIPTPKNDFFLMPNGGYRAGSTIDATNAIT